MKPGSIDFNKIAKAVKDAGFSVRFLQASFNVDPNQITEKGCFTVAGVNIQYGNAIRYNVSMGYRLFPKHYSNYDQPNWNVYVEFQGKKYDAATVVQNGTTITSETIALMRGNYIEVHPGLQYIAKSNLRLEAAVGLSVVNRSYVHFNPLWTFAVQRYFYR